MYRPCAAMLFVAAAACCSVGGCSGAPDLSWVFHNPDDATNQNATYVGSAACRACHPNHHETTRLHGHTYALSRIQGVAPQFPPLATRAGVPNPPADAAWTSVSYVLGGYVNGALFVDRDGYVMTDGVQRTQTQWNLALPPNGTPAGFASYQPQQVEPLPLTYECFRCHTVGAVPQTADNPVSQDSRPGIQGVWAEAGVACEACHGPGSHHVPDPQARALLVDSTARGCAVCHTDGDDPNVIVVRDGYLSPYGQYAELRASGGHANFSCTVCHDPHVSTVYDREHGVRNECRACHADQNLAFHDGVTFQRGDYTETLACESCHMPYAGRSSSAAGGEVVSSLGARLGDVRSHVFRIDTQHADYRTMFSADGTLVVKDDAGRAAVTPDFVCLRCHNGVGNAFVISAAGAAQIGQGMHTRAAAR